MGTEDLSAWIGKKVVVMEFGEPREKNVIGCDYETNQIQLQTEGRYGYYYTSLERVMTKLQIEHHFMQKYAEEAKRLSIKKTIMESNNRLTPPSTKG